jgi:hypothetical protein
VNPISQSVERLVITSPKRNKLRQRGWEGLFPYYAGYPEAFAAELLSSAALPPTATVLDPWNGSGTTIAAATSIGLTAVGYDLNPVMVIVAHARLLPPSEADSLRPLAATIVQRLRDIVEDPARDDPLQQWFSPSATAVIRAIEAGLRSSLIGERTLSKSGVRLENLSGTAAILYVALFNACRNLAASFKSSNPTWTRIARSEAEKVDPTRLQIVRQFNDSVRAMAASLASRSGLAGVQPPKQSWSIGVADATRLNVPPESVDFVLTSPPYCTRLDYTSATRIELAVIHCLMATDIRQLNRQMTGSTLSPNHEITIHPQWGETCGAFLRAVEMHPSKASATYYYKTHLDYFAKMWSSMESIGRCIKPDGVCVMVIQDSHYKEVHNDVPTIIAEMASHSGLQLKRQVRFENNRSMSRVNPGSKIYARSRVESESVLCFRKRKGEDVI